MRQNPIYPLHFVRLYRWGTTSLLVKSFDPELNQINLDFLFYLVSYIKEKFSTRQIPCLITAKPIGNGLKSKNDRTLTWYPGLTSKIYSRSRAGAVLPLKRLFLSTIRTTFKNITDSEFVDDDNQTSFVFGKNVSVSNVQIKADDEPDIVLNNWKFFITFGGLHYLLSKFWITN